MNIQKELNFIKEITLGLLNKKGISFELGTRPLTTGDGHLIKILMVNAHSSIVANYQQIQISYITSKDFVFIHFLNGSDNVGCGEIKKSEAPHFLKKLLDSKKGKERKEFSSEDDVIDFYNLFSTLSEQIFSSNDMFELNHWKADSRLSNALNREYNSLINPLHIHGGIGTVTNYDQLHTITTTIDFGTVPEDGTTYLGVHNNIADGTPKYPEGIYPNATLDMFLEAVIEQYQKAWNRTK